MYINNYCNQSSETKCEMLVTSYHTHAFNWWLNGFFHRLNFGYMCFLKLSKFSNEFEKSILFTTEDINLIKTLYFQLNSNLNVFFIKELGCYLCIINLNNVCKLQYCFFSLTENSNASLKNLEKFFKLTFRLPSLLKISGIVDILSKTAWFSGFSDVPKQTYFKINTIIFKNKILKFFSFFLVLPYFVCTNFLKKLKLLFRFNIVSYFNLTIIYFDNKVFTSVLNYLHVFNFNSILNFFFKKIYFKYFNFIISF